MMRNVFTCLILVQMVACSSEALAHSGGLDSRGGHYNRSTGEYHFHRRTSATTSPSTPSRPSPSYSSPTPSYLSSPPSGSTGSSLDLAQIRQIIDDEVSLRMSVEKERLKRELSKPENDDGTLWEIFQTLGVVIGGLWILGRVKER